MSPLYTPPRYTSGFIAKSGWVQHCSTVVATAAATIVDKQLSFMPLDIGPLGANFSGLECSVSLAEVGGTTTTTLAAYPDLGDGSGPLMTGGPIVSGTVTLTGTSARSAAVTWTPNPGRYWLAFLYVVTSAPSVTSQLFCVSSAVAMPASSSSGNTTRALTRQAQTAMPTTQPTLTPSNITTCPALGARAV